MPTGGDGTAYYGEEVIGEKVMTKKDIKKRDEIADAISTKDMKDRYGDKNVKYAIATKIVMDKKKKKKEEMKEELDEKDKPFVKKLVKNLKKGSKTHEKQAEKLEKAMKENTAIESELVIQDWNSDDIKFTEIETVDIIKAKPLKEEHSNWRLDEKFTLIKTLGKPIIKATGSSLKGGINPRLGKAGSFNAAILTTNNKLSNLMKGKLNFPIDPIVSQNIQTKSVVNTAKKIADQGKKVKKLPPNKQNVTVDVSRDINIDKMFDKKVTTSKNKKFGPKKKGGDDGDAPSLMASYDWRSELELGEDWQKVNRKDKTDGLSQKAVNAYRRENPGSKLKTAVTKDPKKLKKGSKSAKRRLSFCRRMKGMKKKLTSAKTSRDPDSRINKALRRWNC